MLVPCRFPDGIGYERELLGVGGAEGGDQDVGLTPVQGEKEGKKIG